MIQHLEKYFAVTLPNDRSKVNKVKGFFQHIMLAFTASNRSVNKRCVLKRRNSNGEWIVSHINRLCVQIPHSEVTCFGDVFPLSSKESHYACPAPTQIPSEFAAASFTSSGSDTPVRSQS